MQIRLKAPDGCVVTVVAIIIATNSFCVFGDLIAEQCSPSDHPVVGCSLSVAADTCLPKYMIIIVFLYKISNAQLGSVLHPPSCGNTLKIGSRLLPLESRKRRSMALSCILRRQSHRVCKLWVHRCFLFTRFLAHILIITLSSPSALEPNNLLM